MAGLSEEDLKAIAAAVTAGYPTQSRGLHVADFLLGLILSILVGGAAFFLLRSNAGMRFSLRQKADAVEALKDMDEQQLRDILGNADLPSWIQFPDFERVGWFNDIVAQLWPYINSAVSAMARDRLDPMLQESKPGWIRSIKLFRFDLGSKPPQANGVKVYRNERVTDQVIVELDCIWSGDQDVQMVIKPIPHLTMAPEAVSKLLSTMIQLRVGTEKLILNGRVRIIMKPLMDELPIVGAIQVAFTEQPSFSLALTLYGGDISILPGLEAYLQNFVRDSILRPYVLPERYTIPLVDAQNFGIEMPQGMLFVKLIEATGIPRMDLFSKSDPFVKMYVRDKVIYKSQVKENNHHPVWNEDFKFLVHEPQYQALSMILYDYDMLNPDDEIGRCSIPINDLNDQEHYDLWLEVYDPAQEAETRTHQKGKGLVNGITGTLRNVKDLAGHAIDDLEKAIPGDRHKKCRVHIDCVWYKFREGDFHQDADGKAADEAAEAATNGRSHDSATSSNMRDHEANGAQTPGEAGDVRVVEDSATAADARSMLRGGVLYVKPKQGRNLKHKSWYKGGVLPMTTSVKVTVSGTSKHTVASKGDDPIFSEVLEFMLGEDEIGKSETVTIELWDYRLKNQFQGGVTLALKEVMDKQRMKETFKLEGVSHGEVDVELRWLSIMQELQGHAAATKGQPSKGADVDPGTAES